LRAVPACFAVGDERASASAGILTVQAPARSTDAPPGTYLLFVIDRGGVPSHGRIVRIEPAAG
jgi:large repetitive protein